MYVITHRKRDGSVERRVENKNPSVSPDQRERDMVDGIKMSRELWRSTKGYNKRKTMKLVARIPVEVLNHVRLNEGQEAAADTRHVLRRARELGIDCRMDPRGRI